MRMAKVGIVGASGYTGAELLRLCAGHPELEVAVATGESQAGTRAANLYPSVAAAYPDLVYSRYDRDDLHGLDLGSEALAALLTVDPALWRKEIADMREYLSRYGQRLPGALLAELRTTEERLS